jgi:hypothetical protein
MDLQEFRTLPIGFCWGGIGGDDCTTWLATRILYRVGADPAASLRGTYSTAEQAHGILEKAGGLVAFVASHVEPLGFVRLPAGAELLDDDIGVIVAPDGIEGRAVGAIRFGPLWMLLGPAGVIAKKSKHIAAWRLVE